MVERDREGVRDTERTTVVHTDGDRGGSAGLIIGVIVLIALAVLAFFLFGGRFAGDTDRGDVDVDIELPQPPALPEPRVPDVEVPDIEMPDVDINPPATDETDAR